MGLVFYDCILPSYFSDDRYPLLLEAQDLDLVVGQFSELEKDVRAGSEESFQLGNKAIALSTAETRRMDLGVCTLTTFGRDLLKFAGQVQPPPMYVEELMAQLTAQGLTVRVGDVSGKDGDRLRVRNLREV